jgi:hypothetical protein
MEPAEDRQLARLYDYTKFHIGIYLSFAAGISALLGTEKTSWFVSELVAANTEPLYWSLAFMLLAGMCGGVVASSTIECKTFNDFWAEPHGPQSLRRLGIPGFRGSTWAMLEHFFFWLSLLFLAYAIAIGFASTSVPKSTSTLQPTVAACCCGLPASAPSCTTR